jgi:hypothetical protein
VFLCEANGRDTAIYEILECLRDDLQVNCHFRANSVNIALYRGEFELFFVFGETVGTILKVNLILRKNFFYRDEKSKLTRRSHSNAVIEALRASSTNSGNSSKCSKKAFTSCAKATSS